MRTLTLVVPFLMACSHVTEYPTPSEEKPEPAGKVVAGVYDSFGITTDLFVYSPEEGDSAAEVRLLGGNALIKVKDLTLEVKAYNPEHVVRFSAHPSPKLPRWFGNGLWEAGYKTGVGLRGLKEYLSTLPGELPSYTVYAPMVGDVAALDRLDEGNALFRAAGFGLEVVEFSISAWIEVKEKSGHKRPRLPRWFGPGLKSDGSGLRHLKDYFGAE